MGCLSVSSRVWMTPLYSRKPRMTMNMNSAMRDIHRHRTSEGSRAKPTGLLYVSRFTRRWYRARGYPWRSDRDSLPDAPAHLPSFLLGHAAPDAGILAGLYRPLQARILDQACSADGLRRLDLRERGSGRAYREEDLGIDVSTRCLVTPVHVRRTHRLLRPPKEIVNDFSKERPRIYNGVSARVNTSTQGNRETLAARQVHALTYGEGPSRSVGLTPVVFTHSHCSSSFCQGCPCG